jgi:hypothetical protein
VVTLPERLAIEETLELCDALAREVGLPADRVVVNRVPLPMAPGALADARGLVAGGGALGEAAASLVRALEAREAASAEATAALEALTLKQHALWRVPLAPVDPSARDVARWLRGEGAA